MSLALKKAVQSYQGGDFPNALTNLRRVMETETLRNQEVYSMLGNTHLRLGQSLEAGEAFAKGAMQPGPGAAILAKFAMGLFSRAGSRSNLASFGARAMQLHPGDTAIAFDYANALFGEGRFPEVADIVDHLDRDNPVHLALIINTYRLTGQFALLSNELDLAHRKDPDNMLISVSRYVVAREIADMPVIAEHDRIMQDLDRGQAIGLYQSEPALGRLLWSKTDRVNALPNVDTARLANLGHADTRRPVSPEGQRLKVGYLSADFMEHPTMRLFDETLALHDRSKFDITLFCYTQPDPSQWQTRNFPVEVMSRVVFVGGLSDEEAAREIALRNIDILVDLKGHTMNARLGIAKLSDAPVKVTYLGYPGSVAGAGFDYALTDPVVTPDQSVAFFEEALCRLPECYQANGSARRPLPKPSSRAEAGLPEDRFVFASFNAVQKITPETMALWCRVLKATPQSVIWVFAEREEARANLRKAFADQGITADRVLFARGLPYEKHVARLGLADLGLDTFPYNGHTTTSDMLWAGLPLLTMKGEAFQARVSESLLKAAGLDGLVADDADGFCRIACELVADPARISDLKAQIEDDRFRMPLFDSARFTAHLEDAFRLMAERARKGRPPALIDVPALPQRTEPFSERRRT